MVEESNRNTRGWDRVGTFLLRRSATDGRAQVMPGRMGGTTSRWRRFAVAFLIAAAAVAPSATLRAQSPGPAAPTYHDPGAASLHAAAMAHHAEHEDRLRAYEATVTQRIGVSLRTRLRDRTVYRAETAHRVFWNKDGPVAIEVLGLREQTPSGVEVEEFDPGLVDHVYEPDRDRLLLGGAGREAGGERDPDDFRVLHPLERDEARHYVFASGDTITLALPDGRLVRAVELRVSPRARSSNKIVGSLWIEPASGALVRATYRLAETLDVVRDVADVRQEDSEGEFRWVPGIFKPWTFELGVVTVDYALWEGDVWLPRRWRGEGLAAAGVVKIPAEFDRSYRFTRVATERPEDEPAAAVLPDGVGNFDATLLPGDDAYRRYAQERRSEGDSLRIFAPRDLEGLASSAHLPPPVWEDAPGFISRSELGEQRRRLDGVPVGAPASTPWWFRWGLQLPDLVRYNRVEGLSVGARGAVAPHVLGRPLSVTGTVRFGTADRHPNARIDLERTTLRRSLTLSGYHELAPTDEGARHLGVGNSLVAAAAGRDDGDYYRRTGAALAWTPSPTSRARYRVSLHSEYHESVDAHTRVALPRLWRGEGWAFRPNVDAEEGWEHALGIGVAPSWGTDPARVHAGLEAAGLISLGDLEHAVASLAGRLVLPLPGDLRLGLLAGGGIATSDVSPQRAFAVGGPGTLRGYAPRTLVGPCQARGRVEVQRALSFGGVSVFTDAGWAGTCAELEPSALMRSAGVGLSLVDGLIRFDLARGFDGPRSTRLDVYLDGLL